ncbi:MAG TPA: hypothetical protein VGB50_12830 [Flavobacterium sp.]|jgi:hypothetical protein
MKKIILSLLLTSYLINGCSGGDDNGGGGNSCAELTAINLNQNSGQINISLSGTSAMYYEISYQQAGNDSGPGNGQQIVLENLTGTVETGSILSSGNGDMAFVFYARAICADGSESEWIGPRAFTVHDFCEGPTNIQYGFDSLSWQASSDATYWQVQYGVEGFTLGSGTTETTSDTNLYGIPMSAGTTYDFYVRSNCSGGLGWSSWSGPYSYHSEGNQNLCMAPTNLTYTISYNNGSLYGITVHYNGNGESLFEYALMTGNQMPGPGDIDTIGTGSWPGYVGLSVFGSYTFYIRGVCENGNRTAWATIEVDE